jgi:hypothetical protein
MTAMRSQIFMLPSADSVVGECAVCGSPVTLRFRDNATGFRVGYCCLAALLEADRALAESPSFRQPLPKR